MLYSNNIAILFIYELTAIFNPYLGGGLMETIIAVLIIISVTILTFSGVLPAESYREIVLVLLGYVSGKIMEKKSNVKSKRK